MALFTLINFIWIPYLNRNLSRGNSTSFRCMIKFYGTNSIPHNIVMDLNDVMLMCHLVWYFKVGWLE